MKTIKILSLSVLASIALASCSSDDDTPEIVNEEEVITTMTVTLTPDDDSDVITLQTRDLDGDGSDDPVITVSGPLSAGTAYDGVIVLLNETEDPAEDITEEVEEESDEHQFFYTISSGLDVTTEYANFDEDGNPLGTEFTLTAGEVSSGTITFTLRHEPTKPNDGIDDAGGETDILATYSVSVE
ncbi:type 1 periplasmic binding fold superfamily protein [Cellulophaga baltica]|uniref:type 1 periplasmic binding fold superfamily protein n=1 Tax=Cellulophaga TaxID=104264 RepID=UPI001C0689CB|nr:MULTISPECIES: type 1 periplasmic binding fold superfamily protein [Cellulophaga]MBU2995670.1 type 1 periplasmic binding fold superfamily protein [Cellulophaga baltica]MDO6767064.1 type 1 periplasmic binding fold superfamily protein [Cellulophaga sp. 1_MG-2023]